MNKKLVTIEEDIITKDDVTEEKMNLLKKERKMTSERYTKTLLGNH